MIETQNLPPDFIRLMQNQLPEVELTAFFEALNCPPLTSIRLNPQKPIPLNQTWQPVLWDKNGFYLNERPNFTLDPLWHAGAYYVQEASSMLIGFALRQLEIPEEAILLDLCAAPGGKSTQLLAWLAPTQTLISNEVISNRNQILRQNITRWGASNALVTNQKAKVFGQLGEVFDVVLVDAPCSGEGLFRKDFQARQEWSKTNVQLCAARQKEILEDVLPGLKTGGFLMYSTCTYEPAENDFTVNELIQSGAFSKVDLNVEDVPGLVKTEFGYQCYPHRLNGEGFYFSVLQKTSENEAFRIKYQRPPKQKFESVLPWLKNESNPVLFQNQNYLFAIEPEAWQWFERLNKQLHFRQAGILLGEEKGKDFVPGHSFALSGLVSENISRMELDLNQALVFLKCGIPELQWESESKGWNLMTYQNLGLGWAKMLPQRMNSYFPKDFRILMDIPDLS